MIVVTRNGRTIVVNEWREWLVRIVVFVAAMLVLALVAFLILGVAVTVGAIAMIVIPAVIVVGLLGSLFSRRG